MRKLLAMASVAFVFAGSAYAADLPVAFKAPPPAPVFSWTGWYFGVNGGGGWGTTDHTASITVGGMPAPLTTGNFNVTGALVGGTAGYNFQMGHWVWGVETDLDWANVSGIHVDLGTQTQLLIDNVKFTSEIVRGGLNFRF